MSVRVFDCPQCGAPVTLRASTAVFIVCEHCRSMVVVRGSGAEVTGVMAALPPDLSPLQIGTRGEWKGRGFEIVGRVRVEWDEGSWNEWCILYDAKTTGWLAEAQGLLMISFATKVAEEIPTSVVEYPPGKQMRIDGRSWTVSDAKKVTCRASEGELPFAAPPQHERTGIDLLNAAGGFASIELSGADAAEVYLGEYVDFAALKLANLRPVPGWDAEVVEEKNRTTALACPECGAAVQLRAVGQTMSAVCGSCGVVIDTATPELRVIQQADSATRALAPLLPIGQRGKLFGTEYEVIGFVAREDKQSKWSEYLLFNPWQGFRWLVTFEGHWTFVERVPTLPKTSANVVEWQGRDYKYYAKGVASVTGVLGEFYWKVRRGERAEVRDYIAPPHILSKEEYPDLAEFAWSHGVYVEPRVVGEAFGVKALPYGLGIYLNQPNPFAVKWKEIRAAFLVALCALIGLHFYFEQKRPEVTVTSAQFRFERVPARPPAVLTPQELGAQIARIAQFEQAIPATPSVPVEAAKALATPHFNLTGGEQRVTIDANAEVNNNWLDLDLDLVNVQTNASFPVSLELSYYHGGDEDGSWTEGSQNASVSIPAVPPGEYFLAVDPGADPQVQSMPFTVRVRAGGVYAANFIVMLGLVLFYPLMLLWRRHTFERERWADSDGYPWERSAS